MDQPRDLAIEHLVVLVVELLGTKVDQGRVEHAGVIHQATEESLFRLGVPDAEFAVVNCIGCATHAE